jgi:hypothetical protein
MHRNLHIYTPSKLTLTRANIKINSNFGFFFFFIIQVRFVYFKDISRSHIDLVYLEKYNKRTRSLDFSFVSSRVKERKTDHL